MIDKVKFYSDKIAGGVQGWYWYEEDTGAWTGPSSDWLIHKENIANYVNGSRTAVQLGGNLGMYPRLLSDRFSKVYTFEPDPLNFYILNLNAPQENIVKIQAALGDKIDMISLNRMTMSNLGMHKTIKTANSFIPQLTLDTFKIDDLDLLMIDVEGYEMNVLQGAIETIQRNKPVIFAESPNAVSGFLDKLGYKFVGMSMMDGIFVC